jgi:aminomethyltransferase
MEATELTKTAFHNVQARTGADFLEWGGWLWTAGFGDVEGEYRAVRERVGLVDGSPLRKWDFRGPDAARAADRLVTQDALGMSDGQVHYSPLCADDGTMLDDVTVFRFGPEHYRLIAALDSDGDHFLERTADLDVTIEHVTPAICNVQLQGPRSREVLAKVTDVDLTNLAYFHFRPGSVVGKSAIVSRTGYSGERGYEIFCAPADAERLWEGLLEAGADEGIRPYGLAAVDLLRIESGLVIVDAEYTPRQSTPFEINLGWAVKLDKPGDFIGKAALRQFLAEPPKRQLVGLVFDGAEAPEDGAQVARGGCVAGMATVARYSPTFERALALAVVESDAAEPGTAVSAEDLRATVQQLPLYDPAKRKPRD